MGCDFVWNAVQSDLRKQQDLCAFLQRVSDRLGLEHRVFDQTSKGKTAFEGKIDYWVPDPSTYRSGVIPFGEMMRRNWYKKPPIAVLDSTELRGVELFPLGQDTYEEHGDPCVSFVFVSDRRLGEAFRHRLYRVHTRPEDLEQRVGKHRAQNPEVEGIERWAEIGGYMRALGDADLLALLLFYIRCRYVPELKVADDYECWVRVTSWADAKGFPDAWDRDSGPEATEDWLLRQLPDLGWRQRRAEFDEMDAVLPELARHLQSEEKRGRQSLEELRGAIDPADLERIGKLSIAILHLPSSYASSLERSEIRTAGEVLLLKGADLAPLFLGTGEEEERTLVGHLTFLLKRLHTLSDAELNRFATGGSSTDESG